MPLMPIEHIDDWEQRLARQDAFFDCAIIDRPVCCITTPKADPPCEPLAEKDWSTHRDRWLDFEYLAAQAVHNTRNTEYLGDALPYANPNLGPELFSCFFGAEMEYGERTTWSVPCLESYDQADDLQFSTDNEHWQQLMALTDALLEAGRGLYYTGLTDLHPGGDAVAAFRDPARLNMDMIDQPEAVKALATRMSEEFKHIFDLSYDKLSAAGQAITCWAGIVSSRKWYVPSNDFSIMISKEMFDEVFLPGIIEECNHLESSIYHLDGPGALRHLPSLLAIDELDAIQWVYGAGQGRASDWLEVYQTCQAANKGLQIKIDPDELDAIMENLKPEGVWLSIQGVKSPQQGQDLLARVARWS